MTQHLPQEEIGSYRSLYERAKSLDTPPELAEEAWRILGDSMRHNAPALLDAAEAAPGLEAENERLREALGRVRHRVKTCEQQDWPFPTATLSSIWVLANDALANDAALHPQEREG